MGTMRTVGYHGNRGLLLALWVTMETGLSWGPRVTMGTMNCHVDRVTMGTEYCHWDSGLPWEQGYYGDSELLGMQ